MITKILVGIGLVVIGIPYIRIGLVIAAFAHNSGTLDRMWIGFNILITLFYILFWPLIFIFFGVWIGIVALIYKLAKLTKRLRGE